MGSGFKLLHSKSLLGCLDCVFRVIILLEDKLSALSGAVLKTLDQVIIKYISPLTGLLAPEA